MTQETNRDKIDLKGFALIEASAGTGKTFTIQELYLQMVAGWFDPDTGVERNLRPDEILVMTYTEAATEELKERIRKILTQGLLFFENPEQLKTDLRDYYRLNRVLKSSPGEDPNKERKQLVLNRIRNALLIFDNAAIYTINGFCNRLRSQYALESGILFNAELRKDTKSLIDEILKDYLRSFYYLEGDTPLQKLLKEQSSKVLNKCASELITQRQNHPEAVVTGISEFSLETIEQNIKNVLTEIRDECHPGMAREMNARFRNVDKILSEWKAKAQISDTGTVELDLLEKLHDRVEEREELHEPFGRFLELTEKLDSLQTEYSLALVWDAAQWTLERFDQMKQDENFITFNDQIRLVLQAVRNQNNPLRKLVGEQYKAAIVDEFQDTDPAQYEIFKTIFGQPEKGHILFFVGDPKQAIYAFRGGDPATYRAARHFIRTNGQTPSLRYNFRSAEKLLDSVNDLFDRWPHDPSGGTTVFADPEVQFMRVEPGKSEVPEMPRDLRGLLDPQGNEDPAPLKFRWLTVADPNQPSARSLDETVQCACRCCAEDIVNLLNSQWRTPEDKRLKPNDIAVLVPDNSDAKIIRDELRKRNVPCVIPKSENVFKSAAAKHLQTVLKAVKSPANTNLLLDAMLTPLLGFSLNDLIALRSNDSKSVKELEMMQEKMQSLSLQWQKNSFLKMFQEMLHIFNVRAVLLEQEDGERLLTDLLHLRDLIQQKITETGLSAAGVLSYLAAQENGPDSDEKETMMETDRDAVLLTTVHSSKGLQYPVVMLPLMFKRNSARRGTVACYHERGGRMVLNLDPDSDPDAVRAIELENLQENMRLLYVALTRAEYSCYLYWGLVSGQNEPGKSGQSALDWLFPTLRSVDWRNLDWNDRPPQLKNVDIQFLYTDDLPVTQLDPEAQQQEKLSCREWNGSIDPNFHFTSFSSLAGKNGGSDEFDYDSDDSENRLEEPEGIFKIPGGAQTGNAWHKILEEIDFASFDPEKDRELIEQKMKAFGVLNRKLKQETREEYVKLTGRMIRHVLDTPLQNAPGEKFSLKDISRNDRLSELKFNYCFHDQVDTGPLPESLSDYVRKFNAGGSRLAIRNRSFSGGYLNGAIDLLFRHNGKLYIADWKSNRINGQVTGFNQDGMAAEMMEHVYYLQYLIYTVAVMKYLAQHLHPQQPLTEAEYEQYFGGVFYFFTRGVDSNVPGQGVFFDRPPFSVIQKLEKSIG